MALPLAEILKHVGLVYACHSYTIQKLYYETS